jgi:glutaminyl-tRNA synthetase
MPTIRGLRRRGVPPEAMRLFVERTGVSKADNNIDYSVLEDCARECLDSSAPRAMAVLEPLRVVVTSWPEGQVDILDAPMHPKLPELGRRAIPFTRTLLIERTDFEEAPPPGYQRLTPGGEVRLRYGYVIKCDEVIKDADGNVVELRCTHEPDTRQGAGRKVKGIIHWLSEPHSSRAKVNLYDRLFKVENPSAEEGDFKSYINENSLHVVTNAMAEHDLSNAQVGDKYQFIRLGYFTPDLASTPDKLIFNRTVTLKDSWAKANK